VAARLLQAFWAQSCPSHYRRSHVHQLWLTPNFVKAVEATGRERLVIAGLWTGACAAFNVIEGLRRGYEVFFVADACGDTSIQVHERAVDRMIQAGAVPTTAQHFVYELQPEIAGGSRPGVSETPPAEKRSTRFSGTVMISPDRPAREIHQIIEAIVEQLTVLPGSEATLKLEIDAEVPSGLERAKVRTLIENATTLGFIEKSVT
jgi:hypothetical protein